MLRISLLAYFVSDSQIGKPPVITTVARKSREVMFKAFENLKKFPKKFEKAFKDCIIGKITIYSDEYSIYNDLPNDLPDIVEGHYYVNHSKREYARGDIHVNSCENRYSFLRTY